MNSLFNLRLPVADEYKPMIQDLVHLWVVVLVAEFLFSVTASKSFIGTHLNLQLLLYLSAGIVVYWMVLRKIVSFS